jgi:hypothetical protein
VAGDGRRRRACEVRLAVMVGRTHAQRVRILPSEQDGSRKDA